MAVMARMRIRMSSDRTSVVGVGLVLLGMLLVVVGVFRPSSAHATQPNPEHKITLCHATHSYSNPYVVINVDVASVLFHGHGGHNGPIFYAEIPKHQKWGDIIPPFDYGPATQYAGKNWTSEGQAIWNAGCRVTPSTTTTSNSTSTSEAGSTTIPSSTTTTTEQGSTTIPSSTTTTTEQGSTTIPSSATTDTVKSGRIATTATSSVVVKGEAVTQLSTTTTTVAAAARGTSLPFTGSDAVVLSIGGLAMIGTGLALVRSRRRHTAI